MGSHTFSVRATDAAGNMDATPATQTWMVQSTAPADSQPMAAYVYSPTAPAAGQAVSFDASSATCADVPCTYSWADDGTDGSGGTQWPLGSGKTMSFTFQGTGVKNVRLVVTDADGDTNSTMKSITVGTTAPPAGGQNLMGSSTIQSAIDGGGSGSGEAFQATATGSGAAVALTIYVDGQSRATTLMAGLYRDVNGHPGTLLNKGTRSAPTAAAWNKVTIPATSLASGQKYWIAVMGTGGGLKYRDGAGGSNCHSESSASQSMTTLPATWKSGASWPSCPLSGYATN
jgi:hypothetical protein